jgi:quercetin dioxygenase-like cupin family protein
MKSLRCSAVLILGLVAGLTAAAAQEAPLVAPKVTVTPLMSTTTTAIGQPIVLPKANVEVRVSLYDIPVGATLAVHKHPQPRYAYVLAGKLRVVADGAGGRSFDYAAGEFLIEMVDTWHHGTNIGDVPVRLLVIDQVEAGQSNTILEK